VEHGKDDPGEARIAAQEVFVQVARERDLAAEYPTAARATEEEALRRVVDVAWRYQFDPDRAPFKREIRELEEYVAKRMREILAGES
jgi:hypothetical protein